MKYSFILIHASLLNDVILYRQRTMKPFETKRICNGFNVYVKNST